MTGFMKPKIEEPEKVAEPVRLTEKTVRLETPDQQARRNTRRPTGRDALKVDLTRPRTGEAGTGLNVQRAGPPGAGVGLNLPRI